MGTEVRPHRDSTHLSIYVPSTSSVFQLVFGCKIKISPQEGSQGALCKDCTEITPYHAVITSLALRLDGDFFSGMIFYPPAKFELPTYHY